MATDDPLWRAIQAAHARWSLGGLERFPPAPVWEPEVPAVGTQEAEGKQSDKASVPTVPTVPALCEELGTAPPLGAADARALWEERAAIKEFCGGMSREAAERGAALELGLPPSFRP